MGQRVPQFRYRQHCPPTVQNIFNPGNRFADDREGVGRGTLIGDDFGRKLNLEVMLTFHPSMSRPMCPPSRSPQPCTPNQFYSPSDFRRRRQCALHNPRIDLVQKLLR